MMKRLSTDTARTVSAGSQNPPARLYLSAAEVGTRYSMSARSVYRHADLGTMPRPVRIGKMVRWSVESLEKWEADGFPTFRTTRTSTPSNAIVPIRKPLRHANEEGPAA